MKNFFKFVIVVFSLLLTSCEKNEDLSDTPEKEPSVCDIDLSQIPETRGTTLETISYKDFADKLEAVQLECGVFMSNEDYLTILYGISSGKNVSVNVATDKGTLKTVYKISMTDDAKGPSFHVFDLRLLDRNGNVIKHKSSLSLSLLGLSLKVSYDMLLDAKVAVKKLDVENNKDDYFMSPEYFVNRHIFIYEVQTFMVKYKCKFDYTQYSFMLNRFSKRLNVSVDFFRPYNTYSLVCEERTGESWITESSYGLKVLRVVSRIKFDAAYNPYFYY